jgi:hypothetical protein
VGVRASDALLGRLRAAADESAEARAATMEIVTWLRARVHGFVVTTLHGASASAEMIWAALRAGTGDNAAAKPVGQGAR